jgi:hypothetical protein
VPRTTSQVIDLAVRENRLATYVLYGFSIVFVLTGVILIIWAINQKQPLLAITGVADTALFWPAVKFADKIRKSNIMLRALEIPLSLAQTEMEAAQMLRRVFETHFTEVASEHPANAGKSVKAAGR